MNTNTNKTYLTTNQLTELRKWIKKSYSTSKHKQVLYDGVILLGYYHGLRISEILELPWDNVSFEDNTITVHRLKGSKSTTQTLNPDTRKALFTLWKWRFNPSYVFARPTGKLVSRQTMNTMFTRASNELGYKINPHKLKHSCGVQLAKNGKTLLEIQQWLGHSQISNTMIYLDYVSNSDTNELFRKSRI